jgi:uncharacterized repeat protein (TIGR01451 family)/MYXO-CTERM domain-containing protein
MTLRPRHLTSFSAGLLCALTASSVWGAPPKLRYQADHQGDAVVFGSTLAVDCAAGTPHPSGATIGCAGQVNVADTAPDLYWRDNVANATITPLKARTSATLDLPSGAKVTYARLYWAALKSGASADTTATLDWLGGPTKAVTADASWVVSYGFASHPDRYYYQSTADVTDYVSKWGGGDFRVTDVEALPLVGVNVDRAFSAWTMVVFYERPGDELRNLALFDGFTAIDPGFPGQEKAEVTLQGFLVPAGYSARMTAITYEGDQAYSGDSFSFNGTKLSDALNPVGNFFNSSRSHLGKAVSGAYDVPKLSGAPGSMAGFDLDTADVTGLVKAGDTSAKVGASSDLDIFFLGGFVTSITNKAPDFPDFVKEATDLNGGALLAGDIVEYTLSAKNSGNDPAVGSVLTDTLDPGLELVPGSIEIVSGGAVGKKTDAADADEAEYDAASRTVRVRLGTGATGTAGGTVPSGTAVSVRFQVKVTLQTGSIPNQGAIGAAGKSGTPKKQWLSDGDPMTVGAQPTIITINECDTDQDCPANKPFCDSTSKTCMPCETDSQCSDPALPACQSDGSCGECSETNTQKCQGNTPVCNTFTGTCELCTPGPNGDASKCQNDPNGPVCLQGQANDPFCGCEKDSDCGGPKSGKVCDPEKTRVCIDGCRGTDGNQCPDILECTSKDASIGACVTPQEPQGTGGVSGSGGSSGSGGVGGKPASGNDESGDDGSCGCRVPSGSNGRGAAALGLILGFGLLSLRRRRRNGAAS